MALVSYDCSDSSDYEENDDQNNDKNSEVTLIERKDKIVTEEDDNKKINNDSNTKIEIKESILPTVDLKSSFSVVSWALLSSKNRTQPIRISVPSLEDDNKEESKSKIKPSNTKSGLFAILPKPKQQLIAPSSLKLKRKEETAKIKKTIKSLEKPMITSSVIKEPKSSSKEEIDDDEDQPQSFFFLPEENIKQEESNTEDIDDILKKSDDFLKKSTSFEDNSITIEQEPNTSIQTLNNTEQIIIESQNDNVELDREALEKLCGRRGKRLAGEVEMVNVSGAELVGDSKLWLTKELTTQNVHYKRSKFDPLQKRKHQITYLAAHAREQELELSNQWANNRMTKKQTQSKYGF